MKILQQHLNRRFGLWCDKDYYRKGSNVLRAFRVVFMFGEIGTTKAGQSYSPTGSGNPYRFATRYHTVEPGKYHGL